VQRAESREQSAENRVQRTESRELRAAAQNPTLSAHRVPCPNLLSHTNKCERDEPAKSAERMCVKVQPSHFRPKSLMHTNKCEGDEPVKSGERV